jgi:tRNA(fMet)-specific endonuclease VapC
MILMDTDILSLLLAGNPRVAARLSCAEDDVAIAIITKVQILRGRHDFLLKASNGEELRRAQFWLEKTENEVQRWDVVGVGVTVAAEFDRLRHLKSLRKIGRADLLIAAFALAHRATLATRNLKDFRQVPGLTAENWAE